MALRTQASILCALLVASSACRGRTEEVHPAPAPPPPAPAAAPAEPAAEPAVDPARAGAEEPAAPAASAEPSEAREPKAESPKPAAGAKRPAASGKRHLTADDLNRAQAPAPAPPTREPAVAPQAEPVQAEPIAPPVAPEPIAKPATRVTIPNTARVRVEVPPGLQGWLDKDPRMQPWLGKVMKVIDACYGDVLASNPNASGTISFQVTMHENARPDPDIQSLPGQLSGVVACATGQLMRARMPLFTGEEGEKYVVRVRFGG